MLVKELVNFYVEVHKQSISSCYNVQYWGLFFIAPISYWKLLHMSDKRETCLSVWSDYAILEPDTSTIIVILEKCFCTKKVQNLFHKPFNFGYCKKTVRKSHSASIVC